MQPVTKMPFYRFMKNGAANWNKFTSLLASKIAHDVITPADSKNPGKCLSWTVLSFHGTVQKK